MKLFGVVPLVCGAPPTVTLAPVVENVATRAVTLVPAGMVAATVVPVIVATTSVESPAFWADRNDSAVRSLAGDRATTVVTV